MTPELINQTTRGILYEFTLLLAHEFPGVRTSGQLAQAINQKQPEYQQCNKRKLDIAYVQGGKVSCSTASMLLGLHQLLISGNEPTYHVEHIILHKTGLIVDPMRKPKTRAHTAVETMLSEEEPHFWQLWKELIQPVPDDRVEQIREGIRFTLTPTFFANRVSRFQLTKPAIKRVLHSESKIPAHCDSYNSVVAFLREVYARGGA